ncbi:MAG: methylaspartate mutase subunit E [Chloroflexota bacterium]
MEVRNKRLTDKEFFKEREEVLAEWPTGKDVSLEDGIAYQKSMPDSKNYVKRLTEVRRQGNYTFCSMMGVSPIEKDIEFARYLQEVGKTDFHSTVIDSLTRNHFFAKAESELKESERTGRSLLNGLPLAYYGVAGARKKVEALDLPVMIWAPATDMRLVDEIGLAGGHTGIGECGSLAAFFHYTQDLPLEAVVRNFQYIYRLEAYYEEHGVPIQHRAEGALSCITPPSLIIAPQIIEHLIAAEQGVKNIQFCTWGSQGSLSQAVATAVTLRKMGREYLEKFGYRDINTTLMTGYATNISFPQDYGQAYAVVAMAPILTLFSDADICYITTVDEAHRIPTKENNATSLTCARMMVNLLNQQKIDFLNMKPVQFEIAMLEKEVKAILDRVIDLGDGDIIRGASRAIDAGVLDEPFSTNARVARKAIGVRDAEGIIRYFTTGNLPFSKEIIEFHRERVADRERKQNIKVDYDTVVGDVMAISKGTLVLPPDWQEKELGMVAR